jgi:hypothetical protein
MSLGLTMALAHAGLAETRDLVKRSPALKRAQVDGVAYAAAELKETSVPGMYRALHPRTHAPMFYAHEGLDYIVLGNGWREVRGADLVPVQGDPAQLELDKRLILAGLPLDNDMAYRFGDAKRRVVVVVEAFDCAECRDFEANLSKYGGEYNATVYILPTAQAKTAANAKGIRNIWCGPNPGAAWREIMTNPKVRLQVSDTSNCDPRRSMETSDDIANMLRLNRVPGFILGNVNGRAAVAGFPPETVPGLQKQALDGIMGKK